MLDFSLNFVFETNILIFVACFTMFMKLSVSCFFVIVIGASAFVLKIEDIREDLCKLDSENVALTKS